MCSAIYPLIPRQDFLDVRDPDIYVYIDDRSKCLCQVWQAFLTDQLVIVNVPYVFLYSSCFN